MTSIVERYTSQAFAEAEHARLWPAVWLIAARVERLAARGDFVVIDVGSRSVIVVRDESGLQAFANSCPHRGTRLCDGAGRVASIRCSYHGWTFGLDGALREAPGIDPRPQARLFPLAVEERHGFVWVSMATAASLTEFLGPLDAELEAASLGSWSTESEVSTELECNWKTSVDLHNEALHVPTLHAHIAHAVDWASASVTRLGAHARMVVPPHAPGPPVSTLYYVFPNVQINLGGEEGFVLRHLPIGRLPDRMRLEQVSLRRGWTAAPPPSRSVAIDDASFGAVTGADLRMATRVQRGMETGALECPAWTSHESILAWMHEELTARLGRYTAELG